MSRAPELSDILRRYSGMRGTLRMIAEGLLGSCLVLVVILIGVLLLWLGLAILVSLFAS